MVKITRKLILTVAFVCCLCMSAACDEGVRIMKIELGKLPNKIIYLAGIDKKLDLSGATILTHVKSGEVYEDDIYDESAVEITHNINFNEPGVYEVRIERDDSLWFPILVQVIDKSFLDAYAQDS